VGKLNFNIQKTPISFAIQSDKFEIFKIFVEKDDSLLNFKDNKNETPLDLLKFLGKDRKKYLDFLKERENSKNN
jgi:hypothetical protein